MSGYERRDRFNEEIKRGIAEVLREDVKDPRVPEFVSVTRVETARDLSAAKVYISALVDEKQAREMMRFFKDATGYLRHMLGERVQLRQLPELTFVHDRNIEYGARIAGVLQELNLPKEEDDE